MITHHIMSVLCPQIGCVHMSSFLFTGSNEYAVYNDCANVSMMFNKLNIKCSVTTRILAPTHFPYTNKKSNEVVSFFDPICGKQYNNQEMFRVNKICVQCKTVQEVLFYLHGILLVSHDDCHSAFGNCMMIIVVTSVHLCCYYCCVRGKCQI
jgi:hypothetical protein